MRYTWRNIPKRLDSALRRRARRENKTLTQVAIEAMSEGLGIPAEWAPRRSVRDLLGARGQDPELEAALEAQRQIGPAANERRLQAMADAVAAYEAEFGPIGPEELAVQERADVRGRRRTRARARGDRR